MNYLVVQEAAPGNFVELHQFDQNGVQSAILSPGEGPDSVIAHPWIILDLWSDQELVGIGIHKVAPAPPPAAGTVTGYHFALVGGVVTQVLEVTLPTPPTLDEVKTTRSDEVMALRDAKIDAGLTFNGTRFQTRPQDRENISGASLLAFMAVVAGAQPGDLRWNGGDTDFQWIAEDNSVVKMDAQTVIEFGKAEALRKSECIFVARALKDLIDEARTVAAVNAIDINAAWPA